LSWEKKASAHGAATVPATDVPVQLLRGVDAADAPVSAAHLVFRSLQTALPHQYAASLLHFLLQRLRARSAREGRGRIGDPLDVMRAERCAPGDAAVLFAADARRTRIAVNKAATLKPVSGRFPYE